jgi:hypothetical protein
LEDEMKQNGVLDIVCEFYVTKGKWRSYNLKPWVKEPGKTRWSKTTALGDIIVKFHRDFYKGIENGTINWKMK